MEAPIEKPGDENPYAIHSELQDTMQELVGIIRQRDELEEALARLERLRARAARAKVSGSRIYNPGWHLALDLENLIGVSEAVTRSALIREESRGGHTREDFPKPDPGWGTKNVVTRKRDGRLAITTEPIAKVPEELRALLGEDKPPARRRRARRPRSRGRRLMPDVQLDLRGDARGATSAYTVAADEGMSSWSGAQDPGGEGADLAVRWNCKAGSAAPAAPNNGHPKLCA